MEPKVHLELVVQHLELGVQLEPVRVARVHLAVVAKWLVEQVVA